MSFYDKNLGVFKQYSPDIYEEIVKNKPVFNINNVEIKNQYNYIMQYENLKCHLYSEIDVQTQISRQFKNANHDAETVILFGFGLGYEVEYMVNNFSKLKNIIIVEPNLNLFKEVLKYFNIPELVLKVKNVSFVLNKDIEIGPNLTAQLLTKFFGSKVDFVFNIAYRTIFNEYYDKILDICSKELRNGTINIATMQALQFIYYLNYFKNFKIGAMPIEILLKQLKKVPFIIVSAGPSLNKNMHLLKEVKDKALICAAGTAIQILEKNGIKPHLRFAIDAMDDESDLFDGIEDNNIGLVYGNFLHYETLLKYKGPKIRIVMDLEPLVHYVYKKADMDFKLIRSGFSVSNVVADIACKCEAEAVIMIGQDLCYTGGELYAKGAQYNKSVDFTAGYTKLKNIYNEDVYTSTSYIGMKNHFEKIISDNPNIKFINATEGGLPIDGAENKNFADVLENLRDNINVSDILNETYKMYDENLIKSQQKNIMNVIKGFDCDIKEIEDINNERLKWLRKIQKDISKEKFNHNRVLSDIEYVEEFEVKLFQNELYKEVIIKSLDKPIYSLNLICQYDAKNSLDKINKKFKFLSSMTMLVFQQVDFFKQMLEEY